MGRGTWGADGGRSIPVMAGDVPDPSQRIEELRSEIRAHGRAYYEHDAPTVPDATYDGLVRELQALEAEHPELVTPDSPTQQVGAAPSSLFAEVTHAVPMMSLDNAMEAAELDAWAARLDRRLAEQGAGESPEFACELKFDGLAISVRYEAGLLVQAATRATGG